MRPRQLVLSLGMLACAALGAPGHASAADFGKGVTTNDPSPFQKPVPNPSSKTITGDWSGVRSDLRDAGIDFQFDYTNETASNVRGDVARHTLSADQITLGLKLDLDELLDLKKGEVQLTVTDRNGQNLSDKDKLNTLQLVQEVYGRGQTWRITQLWYDQKYFNDALDWKIGRISVGEDFSAAKCDFMNLTFCGSLPGNLVGDVWFNWPVSVWATRVKIALNPDTYLQTGVYEVSPNYLNPRYGLKLGDAGGPEGALIPFELGWSPKIGPSQLKGDYQVGTWYDTSKAPDVVENTQGLPLALAGGDALQRHGRYGVYFNTSQQLWHGGEGDQGPSVRVFFSGAAADRRTSTTDNVLMGGAIFAGVVPGRPTDDIGVAIGRTHVNDRIAAVQRLQNAAGLGPVDVQSSEYVGELYYTLHLFHGAAFRPDLQYINQPNAVHQKSDLVLGLKAVLKF